MSLNQLEIRFVAPPSDGDAYGHSLWIDGEEISAVHTLDWRALLLSLRPEACEYFEPFTCECGSAACAGIGDVALSRGDGLVRWGVMSPLTHQEQLAANGFTVRTFAFDARQYRDAVIGAWERTCELIRGGKPFGFWPMYSEREFLDLMDWTERDRPD